MTNEKKDASFCKFLLLCLGGFVTAVGSGITSFGLGVYVFELTGLASATSLIMLLAFFPGLLLTPLAGVLADRYDRRLLMILGDGLSAFGLVFILIQLLNGAAELWQIGFGVTISSIFSSLTEPAFKSTITDLLTEGEYSTASGFVQLISSAKFLISPLIAGLLLAVSDIKLLLIIDICTIVLTVITTSIVRKGLETKKTDKRKPILKEFKLGWQELKTKQGVFVLTFTGIAISFFLAGIESLYTPMVLGFSDSSVLGIATTICASGMLFSSILLSFIPIKKSFSQVLSVSLFLAGVCMAGFGLRENIVMICFFGFLFFAMLPFANTSIDYLIRTNIPNEVQGRVWGLFGLISQFGFIIAYATLGPLADSVFVPLLKDDQALLANSVGKILGTGNGRGIGLLIIISGFMLASTAIVLFRNKSVKQLEKI